MQPVDGKAHIETTKTLERLRSIEARRDQELLALRYQLSANYDRLMATTTESRELTDSFSSGPLSLSGSKATSLSEAFFELSERNEEKIQAIDDFATFNASLNNAIRILPTAAGNFVTHADSELPNHGLAGRLDEFLGTVFRFSLTRDEALARKSEQLLTELSALIPDISAVSARSLDTVLFLGRTIIHDQHAVDDALRAALSIDITQNVVAVSDEVTKVYELQAAQVHRTRWLLLGGCVALLFFAGFTLIRFDRLNATIEQKVVQRTEELEASQAQFRSLLETTNAIPWIWDVHEARFSYVGPQVTDLLGSSAEEWLSTNFWQSHISADSQDATPSQPKLLADGDGEVEVRLSGPNNQLKWVRCIARTTERNTTTLSGFLMDVTERRTIEADLQHAQKLEAIGQLAAGIAHEINTPTQYSGTIRCSSKRASWNWLPC